MDKQKTQRIVGIVVIIAFVIILIPLFFSKTDLSSEVATNKTLPLPEQSTSTPTLVKGNPSSEGQTPDDSVILSAATEESNSTGAPSGPIQNDGATMAQTADDSVNKNQPSQLPAEQTAAVNNNQDDNVIDITPEVANQINSKTEPTKTEISSHPDVAAASGGEPPVSDSSNKEDTNANLFSETQSPALQSSKDLDQPVSNNVAPTKKVSETVEKPKKHKIVMVKKKYSNVKPVNFSHSELAKLKSTAWVVQMGNFNDKNNARRLADKLRNAGYKAFTKEIKSAQGHVSTRVYIGPEFNHTVALQLSNKVEQNMKMHGIVVSIKPLEL